jgi:hypothetical protein
MRPLATFVLGAIFASSAFALPDSPLPKVGPPQPIIHQFWDKPTKVEVATMANAAAMDIAQTCHALAHGGREMILPTQSCAGVTGYIVAEEAVALGATLLLHGWGHHKLERIPMLVMIGANVKGLAYSHGHGSF